MARKFKLVEVVWEDITGLKELESIEAIKAERLYTFRQLGYLVAEDKDIIRLAGTIPARHVDKHDGCYREVSLIPRTAIKSIREIGSKR